MICLCVKQHDVQKMNATFNGWNSHITMDGNEFYGEYVNGLPNGKGGIFMEDHLFTQYFKDGMLSGSGVFWFLSGDFCIKCSNFKESQSAWAWRFISVDGEKQRAVQKCIQMEKDMLTRQMETNTWFKTENTIYGFHSLNNSYREVYHL